MSAFHKKPQCPQCGSLRIWKDGLRYLQDRTIQRYLCRNCAYRFSEPQVEFNISTQIFKGLNPEPDLFDANVPEGNFSIEKGFDPLPFKRSENVTSHISSRGTITEKQLNAFGDYNREHRVCDSERESKNLVRKEVLQQEKGQLQDAQLDIRGALVEYEAKQILAGLKAKTIQGRLSVLHLLTKRGADLRDPESVFKTIDHVKKWDWKTRQLTDREWSEGSKNNACQSYKSFCDSIGIKIPKYINFDKYSSRSQKIPWIPLEQEIDSLIAGCSRKVATFLQLLKETWCRSGEAWNLEWTDIDMDHNIITLNSTEKKGTPRQFKVSSKLVAMLNQLPKTSQKVFGEAQLHQFRKNFIFQRRRIAHKLQNPRINSITFHTLRHWGATMEYHRTKDLLHVKERLGHRSITSTIIYTHMVKFESDEFYTKTSKSLKEDEELLKAGFEYVTERDDVKIYRKRK